MHSKAILFFSFVFFSVGLSAQNRIEGSIHNAKGEPMPFVTIATKAVASSSNADGSYAILVANDEFVLQFSFVGYSTKVEAINNRTIIDVILEPEIILLNDAIVVAYGTVNKKSNTGGVSVISALQLEKLPSDNVSKLLAGTVSGVQASAPSGQPGEDTEIRIRGLGSINASSKPLYVLDGVPYDGSLSALNTADIENISVLKEAASSALFGSRGANGVVMITSKQGHKNQKAEINLKLSQGFSGRAVKDYEQISTDQYFELYWETLRNSQLPIQANAEQMLAAAQYATDNVVSDLKINPYGSAFPKPVGLDGKLLADAKTLWDYDWGDYLEQTATRSEANLNVNGGSDHSRYFISGGYLNEKGAFIESGFERYNARVNVNSDVKKWLGVGLNLTAAHSNQDSPRSQDAYATNVVLVGRLRPSFYPVYEHDENGNYKLDANGNKIYDFGLYRPSGAGANSNLYATMPNDQSKICKDEASIRTYIDIRPMKGLSFKMSLNNDLSNRNDKIYKNPFSGPVAVVGGVISNAYARTNSYTLNQLLTYDFRINTLHHFNVLAGHEYYNYNYRYALGEKSKMIAPWFDEFVAAAQIDNLTGYSDLYKIDSYLGRAEYDFNSKYYASISFRRDGSSHFHPNSRWGNFWSMGASWILSEEEFLKKASFLNNLKLKASYGAQGNDNINTYYAYQNLYQITGMSGQPALKIERLGNKNLKWEHNLNLNIGVEFGVLENRVSGSFEFFQRASKDLLFQRTLAPSVGYEQVLENIGAMKNTGFEIQFNTTPIQNDAFRWDLNLNITHYKNRLTDLPDANGVIGEWTKLEVGRSIYDFYMVQWASVNSETGAAMWYKQDADGHKTTTEEYANATKTFVGTALPDVYGGITNTLHYKDWELSALWVYSIGGKIYDQDKTLILENGTLVGRAWSTEILNRWTPDHQYTDVPRLDRSPANTWVSQSDRFLVNRSYARLKNVILSYTIPTNLSNRCGLKNARVYLQGDNLLTIFKTQGLDPEQAIDGTTNHRYPAMRTISMGINIVL